MAIKTWLKWTIVGNLLRLGGRPAKNRIRFYGAASGLRILTLHAMNAREKEHFFRIVDWCAERFDIAAPDDVDALLAGGFETGDRDKLLFTFDDGHARDYPVAEWLARRGIRAIFFVIPSYVDRTVREFVEYHRTNGVEAYDIAQGEDHDRVRGLSRGQIGEMIGMGHRIGAHNFAHRDLGRLHEEKDLEYEIDRAVDSVSSLIGNDCLDFAWAFGHTAHLSAEAARRLRAKVPRAYAAIRGLNVPGVTPAFLLRDSLYTEGPLVASRLFAEGGADDRWEGERSRLLDYGGKLPVA
jgi:peptidoglycan/xylan/chitin deacetylase (PgdA/CDA1 family)